MKRKSLLTILSAVLLTVVLAFALAACNGGSHTHSWSSSWSHNETHHWKECTDSSCNEQNSKATHTFSGNDCTVCGYEKGNVVAGNTVLATLTAAQSYFAAAGETLDDVCGEIEAYVLDDDNAVPQGFLQGFSSVVPLSDDKPGGEGNDKAGFTLDDLEGYLLTSYLLKEIDFYFAPLDVDGIGGQFAWYIEKFEELEEQFAESEQTEIVDNDSQWKFKRLENGYQIIIPVFSGEEGHKNEIIAYCDRMLTATDDGIITSSKMCDENGNALSVAGDVTLPAEYQVRDIFRVGEGKASFERGIPAEGRPQFRLEVFENEDGTYIQFYSAWFDGQNGAHLPDDGISSDGGMFGCWQEYLNRPEVQQNMPGYELPVQPYLRFHIADDGQTGTMKIIRQYENQVGNLNTVSLPASWFDGFNAETALAFDGIKDGDGEPLTVGENYIGTFNYYAYAMQRPEEK